MHDSIGAQPCAHGHDQLDVPAGDPSRRKRKRQQHQSEANPGEPSDKVRWAANQESSQEATDEQALRVALGGAWASGGPNVIVVPVRREYPESAGPVSGWWDVPVPASLPERRGAYEREVATVRHDAVRRG